MDLKISIDDETYNHFLNNKYTRNDVIAVHTALNNAKPDIIRCKDCKYFNAWRTSEGAEKYGQIYECSKLVIINPSLDDYCSKAESEESNGPKSIKS